MSKAILCVSVGNLNEFLDLNISYGALNLCVSNQKYLEPDR